MSRYNDHYGAGTVEYVERPRSRHADEYGFQDPRVAEQTSIVSINAPSYGVDYRKSGSQTSLSIVRPARSPSGHREDRIREERYREDRIREERLREERMRERSPPASVTVQEAIIEHEHHHIHHHIDHGERAGLLAIARLDPSQIRPRSVVDGGDWSDEELDRRQRRYKTGTSVTTIAHTEGGEQRHRHRRRHRSRSGTVRTTERFISRSDVDLTQYSDEDNVTIVDVPTGSRRVYVNLDNKSQSGREREFTAQVDWRRERGIRRSRGMGSELWTEITKDLVCREAIEEFGYPYEETEFFFYIFEYLDRDQIRELRDVTDDIRRERVRDIEYLSLADSRREREMDRRTDYGGDDNRTEIIIAETRSRDHSRQRRRYYR